MSKLSNFYQHKAALQQSGEFSDVSSMQWDALEEKLIREDLMPRLMQQIAPLLQEVQSALSININYNPEGTIAATFTRNSIQSVFKLETVTSVTCADKTPDMVADESTAEDENAGIDNTEQEESAQEEETSSEQTSEPERQRKKSVGFSVTFPDGEVICERKAVGTFIKSLQKIGLKQIAKGAHGVEHKGYKVVGTVVRRDDDGNITDDQTQVDDYYIYTKMSNEQKMKDLTKLSEYFGFTLVFHEMSEDGPVLIEQPQPEKSEEPEIVNSEGATIQDQFLRYLEQKISHSSALGYIRHLNNGVRTFINQLVDDKADSVFSFTTPDEVNLCIQLLEESEDYNRANDEQHHYFSAALKQWKLFVDRINEV